MSASRLRCALHARAVRVARPLMTRGVPGVWWCVAQCFIASALGAQTPRSGLACWAAPVDQVVPSLHGTADAAGITSLTRTLQQAGALLEADPAIAAIGDARARLHRTVGHAMHVGAPIGGAAAVWLHAPQWWGQGQGCTLTRGADAAHFASLAVRLNDLDAVLHLVASPSEASETGWFPLPAASDSVGGLPIRGGRVVIVTAPGKEPFVAVTVREHLTRQDSLLGDWARRGDAIARAQQDSLRRHRVALTAAHLDAPVAFGPIVGGEPLWHYVATDAAHAERRWKVNPALWRGARPGAVRAITLELFINNQGDPQTEAMVAWMRHLDVPAWASLLTP